MIEAVDFEEQEKRLKYNHLVANAVAIQNVVDLTRAVRALLQEGYPVRREDLAALSPYQTGHLKRFGDYTLSVRPPEPFDGELVTPFRLEPAGGAAGRAPNSYFCTYLGWPRCWPRA